MRIYKLKATHALENLEHTIEDTKEYVNIIQRVYGYYLLQIIRNKSVNNTLRTYYTIQAAGIDNTISKLDDMTNLKCQKPLDSSLLNAIHQPDWLTIYKTFYTMERQKVLSDAKRSIALYDDWYRANDKRTEQNCLDELETLTYENYTMNVISPDDDPKIIILSLLDPARYKPFHQLLINTNLFYSRNERKDWHYIQEYYNYRKQHLIATDPDTIPLIQATNIPLISFPDDADDIQNTLLNPSIANENPLTFYNSYENSKLQCNILLTIDEFKELLGIS